MTQAQLGPEQKNDAYRERPDMRSMSERHPGLLWIVLLIVICILAVVALRSSKALPR
jgi:flagellar basal body-associated protein FliL